MQVMTCTKHKLSTAQPGLMLSMMPHLYTAGYGKKGGKSGGSGEEESEDVK